jgi:hypothetical protein
MEPQKNAERRRKEAATVQLAERLLLLTYALADAAQDAENGELKALFAERAKILSTLETAETGPEVLEILRKVQVAELEALDRFRRGKAEAAKTMDQGLKGRRVAGAYSSKNRARTMDAHG